ncbi:hypothetical protein JW930_00140 [Candidatus Woesearchaeota archaeon]|nr:hypothetical protein [Candidatus Woesearchaeota archaeon]
MKKGAKKFFLLGLAAAAGSAAGVAAYKHKGKIKKAVADLVKKGKLKSHEGKELFNELLEELKKWEHRLAGKARKGFKKTVRKAKSAVKKTSAKKTQPKKKRSKIGKKPLKK